MLILQRLTLRNFLSVGNVTQTIDLDQAELTLVLGQNRDASDDDSRNGTGKSTILQAISYVLFGEPITPVKLDLLINNINEKNMLVTLSFTVHGKPYRLERGRRPSLLRFFDGGVDLADGQNKHTQVDINRLLSMSYELFVHIVALSTFTEPFLKLKAADQRLVIEELMLITRLSRQAESLKLIMDATKESLRDEEAKLTATAAANQRIERAIDEAMRAADVWQIEHEHHLQQLSREAEAVSAIDIEHELAVFDRRDAWQQASVELGNHVVSADTAIGQCHADLARNRAERQQTQRSQTTHYDERLTQLAEQHAACLQEQQQDWSIRPARLATAAAQQRRMAVNRQSRISALQTDLAALQTHLDAPHGHTCTLCGQDLQGTAHLTTVLQRLAQEIAAVQAEITTTTAELQEYCAQAEELERERLAVEQAQAQRQAALAQQLDGLMRTSEQVQIERANAALQAQAALASLDQQQQAIEATLASLTADLATARRAIAALGEAPVSAYPHRRAVMEMHQRRETLLATIEAHLALGNPHRLKVDGLRATLVDLNYDRLNGYLADAKHEQFLYKLLTAKDSFIRKQIIDQNLSLLNRRLDHYLEQLGLPHEVQFMADLSVFIVLMGKEMDFNQLSRGEMNRVSLAMSWSFRDVWESMNMPVNLLFADEVLESIDLAGVKAAVALLHRTAVVQHRNVFLVSHRQDLRQTIDRVLLVTKENRFTTFADADS